MFSTTRRRSRARSSPSLWQTKSSPRRMHSETSSAVDRLIEAECSSASERSVSLTERGRVTICCPKCASSNGRSIEAVYCECKDPQRENVAIASGLSRQSAPPERRHSGWWLALTGLFIVLTIVTVRSWSVSTTALGACAILSAIMARDAIQYNRCDLPRLLEYWRRSFICTTCGEVFVPAGRRSTSLRNHLEPAPFAHGTTTKPATAK